MITIITIYELLGMIKDEPDRSIYIKYFDKVNKKEALMWACKENIIYKLDQLIIELNDTVEILEEDKKIEKLKGILRIDDLIPPVDENMYKIWQQTIKNHNKINEIIYKLNESEGE